MSSVNKVILIGRLGRDPEVRYTPDGAAICNLSVATETSWKDRNTGEKRTETEWHRVSLFGRVAEVAGEYLVKGRPVYIEGRLRTRKWQDKETGQDRYVTEIIGDQMQMLGGRDDSSYDNQQPNQQYQGRPNNQADRNSYAAAKAGNTPAPQSSGLADMDDDVPF